MDASANEERWTLGAALAAQDEQASEKWDTTWIGEDVDGELLAFEDRGCDRRFILPFLHRLRLLSIVRDAVIQGGAPLRRQAKNAQQWIKERMALLNEGGSTTATRQSGEKLQTLLAAIESKDSLRASERDLMAHLVSEIEIRTAKHHDGLTASLLAATAPRFEDRSTNTQLRWRLTHRYIVSNAALSGLRAALPEPTEIDERSEI